MYKKITHNIVEEHFAFDPRSNKIEKGEDVIELNIPLLIRLLEYAREDAGQDIDLHLIAEKLIDLCDDGEVLTMKDYPEIISVVTSEGVGKESAERFRSH